MKSNISTIFYAVLLTLLIALLPFMMGERLLQINSAFLISAKYLTLPFLAVSFLVHRRKDYSNLWSYCVDKCLILFLCLVISAPCVLAFNKYAGKSYNISLSGNVIKTKPGRGTGQERWREVVLITKKGKITINIAHYLFKKNLNGRHFSMECKIGSLGLVYL
ncbi:hypothetical protein [Zooshikella sp. RANM57]|uniref:hypothetical protein n=1 Tax=Zooshikella sp. RANM57 TaxID=3425863 RepID=UPI003D6EAE81